MKPKSVGRIALAFAGLASIVSWTSCKQKDSLIIVAVTADSMASDVTSLTLSASGTTQVFPLHSGLSDAATTLGLYVPSDVLGTVKVTATASRGTCLGYKGEGIATVMSAGVTTNPATQIMLRHADLCGADAGADGGGAGVGGSGTGGTGGTVGTGGTLGTGGTTATGGIVGTGGTTATGGIVGTGGTTATGGIVGTGGTTATGGIVGTGGVVGTGGGAGCGTLPPAGTPPRFTCCQEYDHESNCAGDTTIWNVAFSPDGTRLISGGGDGRVKVWSFDGSKLTATGEVLAVPGYGYAAFSPDGQHLAIGGYGAIVVYTVGTWAAGTTLTIGDVSYGVDFAPDSQHVISVDPYSLYVHALGTAAPLTTVGAQNDVYGLAVSRTAVSGQLAVAVPGLDAIGDIYSYAAPSALSGPAALGVASSDISERLLSAAVSPSGTLLALGDYFGRVWLSSYPTGAATIPTTSALIVDSDLYQGVQGVAFSPNGSYLAAAADLTKAGAPGTVTIWSVASKSLYASYAATTYSPQSIAFSPNGNAIAVGEYDCGKILLCTN